MPGPRVLVVILAGGAGGRLELLTRSRAKPAMPFGGVYRLIDFPLSNCLHSGLSNVWVIEQFNPVSLTDHLANGRPWDLDRTHGGLLVLHPRLGEGRDGWHRGTADALWRNAALIGELEPDVVVVLSADAVYRLNYADVVARHLESGADVTMVTTRVAAEDAGRYGVARVEDGRVTDYAYKPEEPASDLVTNEVFAFRPARLLALLEELAGQDDGEGLRDLGHAVLPRLVGEGTAREHRFDGYWRDVGTVDSYWSAHMDLLGDEPAIDLDDRRWPIYSADPQRSAARVRREATVVDSLLSPGVRVAGVVERSVLAPGVVVERSAVVRDSVVLHDTVIESGARIERAVVDARVTVGAGAVIGGPAAGMTDPGAGITLVGLGAKVPAGAELGPGARFPEDGEEPAER
ncbi:MAG: glucose-1-phosphate adenylyltransferase family protein [Frankiaceae bacterium]